MEHNLSLSLNIFCQNENLNKSFGIENNLEKGKSLPLGTINKYGEIKTTEGWKWIKKEDKKAKLQETIDKVKGTKSSQKTFSPEEEGRMSVVKDLGGSNGAQLVKTESGELFVRKSAKSIDHFLNEVVANKIYRLLGANVPQLVQSENQKNLYSKYLGNDWKELNRFQSYSEEQRDKIKKSILKSFVADAFTANWDVFGLNSDNILVNENTLEVSRVDLGGSLFYRGMGAEKNFSTLPIELETLRDSSRNKTSSSFFKDISKVEELAQLKDLKEKSGQIKGLLKLMEGGSKNNKDKVVRFSERLDNFISKYESIKE